MSATHYPESISGPRARKVAVDCTTCHIAEAQTECACCVDSICNDCVVRCAVCEWWADRCISCAIKNGFVEGNEGQWYCENCQGEEV